MLRHILLLKPRPDATAASIDATRAALGALVGQIPGLLDFHWGPNIAPVSRQQGYTYGFSMDFSDRTSFDNYVPHPEHVKAAGMVLASFEPPIVLDLEL